jgi:hypothetical protein
MKKAGTDVNTTRPTFNPPVAAGKPTNAEDFFSVAINVGRNAKDLFINRQEKFP